MTNSPDTGAAILAHDPLAYWPLTEREGTVAKDLSGGYRNGTYTGAYSLATAGPPLYDAGSAVDLTGGYVPTEAPSGIVTTYASEILAAGPSLYWRLGSSGLTDQSGNGRNGTAHGGITVGGVAGALSGDADAATEMSGASTQYISSTYSPFVNGTVRTYEMWVWRDTTTTDDFFFGGSVFDGPAARVNTVGSIDFNPQAAGGGGLWLAVWTTLGAWTHFVFVFDEPNNTMDLYINGVAQTQKTVTQQYHASPGNFVLGTWISNQGNWDGRFDEVAIYERALTPTEISDHYDLGASGPVTTDTIFDSGSSLTFTGWAYRDTSGAEHTLLGGDAVPCPVIRLANGSNDFHFLADGATQYTWSSAWPGSGQWAHWALTFADAENTAELFVNGVAQGTKTITETYPATGTEVTVGAYGADGASWDGKLAHVAIFDRILTAAEIQSLYKMGGA